MKTVDSNPILDRVQNHKFEPFGVPEGIKRVVAFGDHSHKCPVYIKKVPPCTMGCPANEDIRGYNNLLRGTEKSDNAWEAAFERITEKNPFPIIMGKVCPHPCESACNRQYREESVAINAVEHSIGEYAINNDLQFTQPEKESGKKVAIVGGGPAGLSCAYQLRKLGHGVTLFDANEKLGGMLRYGILNYRVSRESLDAEIQRIINLGVKINLNTRIGDDISLEQLEKDYDALFVGIGAQEGRDLPIPGFSEMEGTTNSVEFLGTFEREGWSLNHGDKVIVVGDGDVAIDSARLAARLGGSVILLSAVDRDHMACSDHELEDALGEGVELISATGAIGINKEEEMLTLSCLGMDKKEKGEEGWDATIPFLRYKTNQAKPISFSANLVVSSIGQVADMKGFESLGEVKTGLNLDEHRKFEGKDNIFGGGDVEKVGLIVTAVAHGAKAATSIDHLLSGRGPSKKEYISVVDVKKQDILYFKKTPAANRNKSITPDVMGQFDELLSPLNDEATLEEADRCMSCGLCFDCNQCLVFCPHDAISRTRENPIGEVMYTHYTHCVGCHICSFVCPAGYIQMGMSDEL